MFRLPPVLFLIPSCSLLPFPQPLRSDLSSLRRTHFRHCSTVRGPRHLLLKHCCLSSLQVTHKYDWLQTRSKIQADRENTRHPTGTALPSGPILCILIGPVARRSFLWGPVNYSVAMRFLVCFSTGGRMSIHPPYRLTQPFLVVGLDLSVFPHELFVFFLPLFPYFIFQTKKCLALGIHWSNHDRHVRWRLRVFWMINFPGITWLMPQSLINSIHSASEAQPKLSCTVSRSLPVLGFMF